LIVLSSESNFSSNLPIPFYQNQNITFDVDNNGVVTANDSLLIINEISRRNRAGLSLTLTGAPTVTNRYFDVNGDGSITAADSLLIVNALSRQNRAGKSTANVVASVDRYDFDLFNIGSPNPAVSLDAYDNIIISIGEAFYPQYTSRFATIRAELGVPPRLQRKDTGEIKIAYAVLGNSAAACIASDKLASSPRASLMSGFQLACSTAEVNSNRPRPFLIQSQPRFLSIGENYYSPAPNQAPVCIVARYEPRSTALYLDFL